MLTLLRSLGLLSPMEARELQRSTIPMRTVVVLYASFALVALLVGVAALGFSLGSRAWPSPGEPSPPQVSDSWQPSVADVQTADPDVQDPLQDKVDLLLGELHQLSRRQAELEAKLLDKTTEASELAHVTQILKTQIQQQEREIETLAEVATRRRDFGRKFVHGTTRQFSEGGRADGPNGFYTPETGDVRRATSSGEPPAEVLIAIDPRESGPGDRYRLKLEIHNRGLASLKVIGLELVWRYAGRNSGGPIPFQPILVRPRTTGVLYEAEGIWLEEFAAGSIEATVTLEGGGRLTNSLEWSDG